MKTNVQYSRASSQLFISYGVTKCEWQSEWLTDKLQELLELLFATKKSVKQQSFDNLQQLRETHSKAKDLSY